MQRISFEWVLVRVGCAAHQLKIRVRVSVGRAAHQLGPVRVRAGVRVRVRVGRAAHQLCPVPVVEEHATEQRVGADRKATVPWRKVRGAEDELGALSKGVPVTIRSQWERPLAFKQRAGEGVPVMIRSQRERRTDRR